MRQRPLTLRESHDEHRVDGDETEQITNNHLVDHGDERADGLVAATEEEEVGRGAEHDQYGDHVLGRLKTRHPENNHRQLQQARQQEDHPGRHRRLKECYGQLQKTRQEIEEVSMNGTVVWDDIGHIN